MGRCIVHPERTLQTHPSQKSPINDLRNIATKVMAAAFMPGVLKDINDQPHEKQR